MCSTLNQTDKTGENIVKKLTLSFCALIAVRLCRFCGDGDDDRVKGGRATAMPAVVCG